MIHRLEKDEVSIGRKSVTSFIIKGNLLHVIKLHVFLYDIFVRKWGGITIIC